MRTTKTNKVKKIDGQITFIEKQDLTLQVTQEQEQQTQKKAKEATTTTKKKTTTTPKKITTKKQATKKATPSKKSTTPKEKEATTKKATTSKKSTTKKSTTKKPETIPYGSDEEVKIVYDQYSMSINAESMKIFEKSNEPKVAKELVSQMIMTNEYFNGRKSFYWVATEIKKNNEKIIELTKETFPRVSKSGAIQIEEGMLKLMGNDLLEMWISIQSYLDLSSRRNVGKLLLKNRLRNKMTLKTLAKKTNISVTSLRKYETDPIALTRINILKLTKICKVLEIDMQLFCNELEKLYSRYFLEESSYSEKGLHLKKNWQSILNNAYVKSGLSPMRFAVLSQVGMDKAFYYLLNPVEKIDMYVIRSLASTLGIDMKELVEEKN